MAKTSRRAGTLLVVSATLASVFLSGGCTETPSVSRSGGVDAGAGLAVAAGLTRYDLPDRAVAPVVEGPAVVGGDRVSSSRPGRVVVINVWQSTCGPCRSEAAALDDAAGRTAKQATFLGLDVDDQQVAAEAFLRSSASSYDHIYDPAGKQLLKFAGVLPLQAIPSTLVVDRRGRVAARIIGPVGAASLAELITDVATSA